jgi:hypothetical protein
MVGIDTEYVCEGGDGKATLEEPKGRASTFGAPAGGERVRYHDE